MNVFGQYVAVIQFAALDSMLQIQASCGTYTVIPSSPRAQQSFVLPTLSDPTIPGCLLPAEAEVNGTWFLSWGANIVWQILNPLCWPLEVFQHSWFVSSSNDSESELTGLMLQTNKSYLSSTQHNCHYNCRCLLIGMVIQGKLRWRSFSEPSLHG